jgi:integrase
VLAEKHIEPKWRDEQIGQIKPLLVEDWLKKLTLAPKNKSHLKNLLHVLFNAAMRCELIPCQHNPMGLVRVKDSSKRLRDPNALTADEFRNVLENVSEPFRTMCIAAMCLGLFSRKDHRERPTFKCTHQVESYSERPTE